MGKTYRPIDRDKFADMFRREEAYRVSNPTFDQDKAERVMYAILGMCKSPLRPTRIRREDLEDAVWGYAYDACKYLYFNYELLMFAGKRRSDIPWRGDKYWTFVVTDNKPYYEVRVSAPSLREPISQSKKWLVHKRFDNTCVYCGSPSEEVDHVIPVSRGGTNDFSNLVASCQRCNRVKSDRTLAELGWEMLV